MSLDVKNLTFSYTSEQKILDSVSFSAKEGRCLYLLGANGVGKTTLLSCILSFLKPVGSEITVNGKNIFKMKPNERARTIAYVPQKVEFPDITCFDAVLMGRKPYLKYEANEDDYKIVEELFKELRLEKFALRNVNELSGGERQKIAIARALAQNTSVVLFDEPTSNLDVKNQLEVLSLIKNITKERNITVLIVMHDLSLALRYADDFMLMKDGKVLKCGDISLLNGKDVEEVFGVKAEIININDNKIIIYSEG